MELIASLKQYPERKYALQFNVTLSNIEIQCSPSTTRFDVGAPDLSFQVMYTKKTDYKKTLTLVFEALAFDQLGKETDFPPFVKFDEKTQAY